MTIWGRFYRKLVDKIDSLLTLPVAEPKLAVLYGTFAGIILAVGLQFLLVILTDDVTKPWGLRQTAGIILIVASFLISLVAWSLQLFNDFLVVEKRMQRVSLEEKRVQFHDWGGRWFTWIIFWLALMLLVFGAVLLAWTITSQLHPSVSYCSGGQIG